VRAEAQLAQTDEALRALVQRFKDDPASGAFEDLAEALLARGHAAEALQIAEHGLMMAPAHVGGRIQRAAALLALGRTRVAYVELLRALAIEPANRRGMRLLGKVYVDAGFPERAAALLARRHEQASPTIDARPLAEQERTDHEKPLPAENEDTDGEAADIPGLFASLTKDLGLGNAEPIATRIEVTQVMRIRRGERDRGEDELSSIEGPIVDTTQPGKLELESPEAPQPAGAFLFDVVTSPELSGLGAAEDEPLFNEAMPFAVKPVAAREEVQNTVDEVTLNDEQETPIDINALQSAIASETQRLTGDSEPNPPAALPGSSQVSLPPADAAYVRRFDRRGAAREINASLPAPSPSTDLAPPAAHVQLVEPSLEPRRLWLAIGGTVLLLAYLAGLGWLFSDQIAVWMSRPGSAVEPGPRPSVAAGQQDR
jgi:hypothetical protein